MCGIAGYFRKSSAAEGPLGSTLMGMLSALSRRGPDSAGVALIGPAHADGYIVTAKAGDDLELTQAVIQRNRNAIESYATSLPRTSELSSEGLYVRFVISGQVDIASLAANLESLGEGIEVLSIGRAIELSKEVGSPESLDHKHHIAKFTGTHGIGHTRLSTESRVDLSHSQPFWGRGAADVAVVHNGHITNYHQLRRRYEQRGVRFYTENDSEVLGIYLAEQLNKGKSLTQALHGFRDDMDGSYCCLAITEKEIGFAKDPFAFKPLVFAETDAFVAVSTEEIAIRSALPGDYKVSEAQVEEVRVWSI